MTEEKQKCKYCSNPFPSILGNLRTALKAETFKIDAGMGDALRCMVDEGFREIHEGDYCCDNAKWEAEQAYDKGRR